VIQTTSSPVLLMKVCVVLGSSLKDLLGPTTPSHGVRAPSRFAVAGNSRDRTVVYKEVEVRPASRAARVTT
jgi:hypothetical protein